jgi:hypothetical protein
MRSPHLIRGWRLRILLAACGGMAIAFILAWSQPPTYVATSHVAFTEQNRLDALASPWARDLSQHVGTSVPRLLEAISVEANPLGDWVTVRGRHRSATHAASLANAAASALVDAADGTGRVLVSAAPPTGPEPKVPQGVALLGGMIALAVALAVEAAVAALRPVITHPHRASTAVDAPVVHLADPSAAADDRSTDEMYVALRIGDEPTDVIVSAPSPPVAGAIASRLALRLRAAGRSVEALHARVASPPPSRPPPGPGRGADRVIVLPTVEADALARWASGADRVVVAVHVGETPVATLRTASKAVTETGRPVDLVVAADRRPQRSAVAVEECEWAVMD